MIEQAAAALDVGANYLQHFNQVDPFNLCNEVEGFLCRKSDYRYGALVITRVNDWNCQQVIYCTPKLEYPFGRTPDEGRHYHFPKDVWTLEIYDKLDGTNVCAFAYEGPDGFHISYKLRLKPFLYNSRFGPFLDLWREVLDTDPEIEQQAQMLYGNRGGVEALSFEMTGTRNPLLVRYDHPLKATLLFGVKADSRVLPPSAFTDIKPLVRLHRIPGFQGQADTSALQHIYERHRADVEFLNERFVDSEGNSAIKGSEGRVFFLCHNKTNHWSMWKCKPESVEKLHWTSDVLPLLVIEATVRNSLESEDELTLEAVNQLLLEEFPPDMVEASEARTQKVITALTAELEWLEKVRGVYESTGCDMERDGKGAAMRTLSEHFPRYAMGGVYGALVKLGIVRK